MSPFPDALYRNKRVLIAGGLGFIGCNLALRLLSQHAHVSIIDTQEAFEKRRHLLPQDATLQIYVNPKGDISAFNQAVRHQDIIFDVMGRAGHQRSLQEPLEDLEANLRCHLELLEACRQSQCAPVQFVFSSTRQLYGRPKYLPVDEHHPIAPLDANGINIRSAEMYFELYARLYNMRTIVLRLTNTYGPRMSLAMRRNEMLPVFFRRALRGETIHLQGDGQLARDINYIDDVVDALLYAGMLENNFAIFNLGSMQAYTQLEILACLKRHANFQQCCVAMPEQQALIDIGDYHADFGAFTRATGWLPRCDLETGIAKTIDYFRHDSSLF